MAKYEIRKEDGIYRIYQNIKGRMVKIGSTPSKEKANEWLLRLQGNA